MLRIIHKHLILEILSYFLIGLVVFLFVLLIGRAFQIMELIVSRGMSLFYIIKLFALMLPYFLSYTIPMSLVLSLILTFGRLSMDYEVIALKSSGIGLYQLLRPIFLFSIFCYFLATFILLDVAPKTNYNFKKFLINVISTQINVALDEKVFNNVGGVIIYIDDISPKNNKLHGILCFDDSKMDVSYTIFAQEGSLVSDESGTNLSIGLTNARVFLFNKYTDSDQTIILEHYRMNLNIFGNKDEAMEAKKKKREMDFFELASAISKNSGTIRQLEIINGMLTKMMKETRYTENRIRAINVLIKMSNVVPAKKEYEAQSLAFTPEILNELKRRGSLGHEINSFIYKLQINNAKLIKNFKKENREIKVEVSERIAVPFACIVFFLVSIPLGIQTNPRGKSGSMVLAIIIIFVYYIFMAFGTALGESGYFPPLFSMWIGNVILGSFGMYALIKTANESPIFFVTVYNNAYDFMDSLIKRISK